MEISFLIYLVIFIAVIVLIFKVIKKVIFAVFAVLFLMVLVIAGIGGLIYSDFNYLASQNDFDIRFIYADNENYLLGTQMSVINKSVEFDKVRGVSNNELQSLDVKKIDKKGNVFVITIETELFESILANSYDLKELGFESDNFEDFTISNNEVLKIINSNGDGLDEFFEILLRQSSISQIDMNIDKSQIQNELDKNNIQFKEFIFMFTLGKALDDEKKIINIIDGYKNKTLNIYPERFSFKLLKLLPVSTLKSMITDS